MLDLVYNFRCHVNNLIDVSSIMVSVVKMPLGLQGIFTAILQVATGKNGSAAEHCHRIHV